jgi:glutathione synthase
MKLELGIVMDPIESITIKKDSTFAMMLAAQRRGWQLWYMELADLSLTPEHCLARMREIEVEDHADPWWHFGDERVRPLADLSAVLMRKDPPFDMEYIYATYLLEQAQEAGALVVNDPRTLRDANEKVFTARFAQCCPPLVVTRRAADIASFLSEHGDMVLKPLGGMGGMSVFRVRAGDPNLNVIVETLTDRGQRYCMAQRHIPEIASGDKRILLIDGKPVPYALARIPAPGETRGNLAVGAAAEGRPLSERDRTIASLVGPELRHRGVLFAGIDVIGDYLTEVNITSPTCIRELDSLFGLDIAADLIATIEEKLGEH